MTIYSHAPCTSVDVERLFFILKSFVSDRPHIRYMISFAYITNPYKTKLLIKDENFIPQKQNACLYNQSQRDVTANKGYIFEKSETW